MNAKFEIRSSKEKGGKGYVSAESSVGENNISFSSLLIVDIIL